LLPNGVDALFLAPLLAVGCGGIVARKSLSESYLLKGCPTQSAYGGATKPVHVAAGRNPVAGLQSPLLWHL
jgi:hypothetical protein